MMVGKSGARVCVRSTTRMAPEAIPRASSKSVDRDMGWVSLVCQLALERLGIDREARADILGDVAHEDVLETSLQGIDDGPRQRRRCDLGWWHGLKPLRLERSEEHVHHAHAASPQLRAQALRSRQTGSFGSTVGAVYRP